MTRANSEDERDESVTKGRSKSCEIKGMVAIVSAKADWTLPLLRYKR